MQNRNLRPNRVFEVNEVKPNETELAKLLKRWSGRRGSNPRRPAWEGDIRLGCLETPLDLVWTLCLAPDGAVGERSLAKNQ